MKLLQSAIIALSMYTKIPMPQVKWTDENMKYSMCFFPVAGVLIGFLSWLLGGKIVDTEYGRFFVGSIMTLIPILLSGGIHMDGFMDTMDALSSYGSREKKLMILKDPHTGAFAVIGMVVYIILSMAFWSEVRKEMLPVISCGYVLSRALSGLSIVAFPVAKDSGLANTFQKGANRRQTGFVMIFWLLLTSGCMIYLSPISGIVGIVLGSSVFWYYHMVSLKQFGGITGDLAGYFLQLCELALLAGVVLTGGR